MGCFSIPQSPFSPHISFTFTMSSPASSYVQVGLDNLEYPLNCSPSPCAQVRGLIGLCFIVDWFNFFRLTVIIMVVQHDFHSTLSFYCTKSNSSHPLVDLIFHLILSYPSFHNHSPYTLYFSSKMRWFIDMTSFGTYKEAIHLYLGGWSSSANSKAIWVPTNSSGNSWTASLMGMSQPGTCQGHSTPTLPVYYSAPSQGQLVQLAVLTR